MYAFLDANCFKSYIDGLTTEVENVCVIAFKEVTEVGQFILDDGNLFVQEWRDSTGGFGNLFVGDHISDLLLQNKIGLRPFVKNVKLRKQLELLGMPRKDAKIVEFSAGSEIDLILSHDMDFFEPKKKKCQPDLRRKLLHNRGGSLCKFIERTCDIIVSCCCRCREFLVRDG
jgi:hypothetical protein